MAASAKAKPAKKAAAKPAKDAKKAEAGTVEGSLVVGSKVKAYIKDLGLKCSGELMDALNKCVADTLKKAGERTKGNYRSTIKATDL
jgi:hypothetical protein